MSSTSVRSAWNDRFRKPTAEVLLSLVPKALAPAVMRLRSEALREGGVSEEVGWQGVPWHWTIAFHHEAMASRPWFYIVPKPEKPLLVVPFTREAIASLPLRRLLKPVREAIMHAREVDGVRWVQWGIESKAQAETLLKLAKAQLAVATGDAAVASGGER